QLRSSIPGLKRRRWYGVPTHARPELRAREQLRCLPRNTYPGRTLGGPAATACEVLKAAATSDCAVGETSATPADADAAGGNEIAADIAATAAVAHVCLCVDAGATAAGRSSAAAGSVTRLRGWTAGAGDAGLTVWATGVAADLGRRAAGAADAGLAGRTADA